MQPGRRGTCVYESLSVASSSIVQEYFVVTIDEFSSLFPVDPDAVLVREDASRNILIRGIVKDGLVEVSAVEQPWLMATGSPT